MKILIMFSGGIVGWVVAFIATTATASVYLSYRRLSKLPLQAVAVAALCGVSVFIAEIAAMGVYLSDAAPLKTGIMIGNAAGFWTAFYRAKEQLDFLKWKGK